MESDRRGLGIYGEDIACDFLRRHGYNVIERNYRIRGGEVDVIALLGDDIVFIEVKTRRSLIYGYPEEAVNSLKMRRMQRVANTFMSRFTRCCYVRFDIIAIEVDVEQKKLLIRHIKDIS